MHVCEYKMLRYSFATQLKSPKIHFYVTWDYAVRYDEQHEVMFAILVLFRDFHRVENDRRKVGGSEQLHFAQRISVVGQNFWYIGAKWMRRIAVQRELVRNIPAWWQFGAKALEQNQKSFRRP